MCKLAHVSRTKLRQPIGYRKIFIFVVLERRLTGIYDCNTKCSFVYLIKIPTGFDRGTAPNLTGGAHDASTDHPMRRGYRLPHSSLPRRHTASRFGSFGASTKVPVLWSLKVLKLWAKSQATGNGDQHCPMNSRGSGKNLCCLHVMVVSVQASVVRFYYRFKRKIDFFDNSVESYSRN